MAAEARNRQCLARCLSPPLLIKNNALERTVKIPAKRKNLALGPRYFLLFSMSHVVRRLTIGWCNACPYCQGIKTKGNYAMTIHEQIVGAIQLLLAIPVVAFLAVCAGIALGY